MRPGVAAAVAEAPDRGREPRGQVLGLVVALLVAQPDLGQTMLITATWGVMFFLAGLPWLWIIGLGALGASIEARATGWGTGAVGWLTVTYAVVLAALTLGPWI